MLPDRPVAEHRLAAVAFGCVIIPQQARGGVVLWRQRLCPAFVIAAGNLPEGASMAGITHRVVEANGLRMHISEQGEGPLVILCHGFPECWYSWRHQVPALAAEAIRVVKQAQSIMHRVVR
jgi:hypothetical protein